MEINDEDETTIKEAVLEAMLELMVMHEPKEESSKNQSSPSNRQSPSSKAPESPSSAKSSQKREIPAWFQSLFDSI